MHAANDVSIFARNSKLFHLSVFFHFARLRCRFGVHNSVASLYPGSMWATNIVNEQERFADAMPWDHGAHHSFVYGLAGLVPECGVLT